MRGYWERIGAKNYERDYLKRMRDNKAVWHKQDSEITWLTLWEKPFLCERCGKETHLTSSSTDTGFHHAVCKECYVELHAYHVAVAPKLLRELAEEIREEMKKDRRRSNSRR